MTMIEIQDLTLKASRGLDAIHQRLAEYERHFIQRFEEGSITSRIGIFCAAVPLQPLAAISHSYADAERCGGEMAA
jgi:hypothetical protein